MQIPILNLHAYLVILQGLKGSSQKGAHPEDVFNIPVIESLKTHVLTDHHRKMIPLTYS